MNKNNTKKTKNTSAKKAKPKNNLDDILGDFMKQLEQKAEPKVKPITINADNHRAEDDSGKKLDWQKITTSKFADKKGSNYKNISNSNNMEETIDIYDEEESTAIDIGAIDLKQAVIYKEILDRKYFTI